MMAFQYLLLFVFSHLFSTEVYGQTTVRLAPSVPKVIKLQARETIKLITHVDRSTNFVVIQAHSHLENITLTSDLLGQTQEVTGNDVGLVNTVDEGGTTVTTTLSSISNKSVSVLVGALPYGKDDPLVGGCSLVSPLTYDPNLKLTYTWTQSVPYFEFSDHNHENRLNDTCESYARPLTYELYVLYIPGHDRSEITYFTALQKMMSVDMVHKYGSKVSDMFDGSSSILSKFTVASYIGQGVVYSVVVKDTVSRKTKMAAYIPAVTYSCNLNAESTCRLIEGGGQFLLIVGGIVGLYLCFLGHRYFYWTSLLVAFLAFSLVFVMVFSLSLNKSLSMNVLLAGICGVVFAVCWLVLCIKVKAPALPVLLTGLMGGYIVASVIFYTPFGNIKYWHTSYGYGLAFTVGVLVIPAILLYFMKVLSIVSCAFIGGFLVCIMLSGFLQAGFHYSLINSLRHATDSSFIYDQVVIVGPWLTAEIVLCVFWGLLFVAGTITQMWMARGCPDFPEPPKLRPLLSRETSDEENKQLCTNVDSKRVFPENHANYATLYGGPELINSLNSSSGDFGDPYA